MFHFASSILQGLVFLDTMKICHLDLKAENLLYSESGGILNFRICDFGAAERLPFLGGMRGTAHWMAPEIIRGFWAANVYGHKNDLWSFGIALIGKFITYILIS